MPYRRDFRPAGSRVWRTHVLHGHTAPQANRDGAVRAPPSAELREVHVAPSVGVHLLYGRVELRGGEVDFEEVRDLLDLFRLYGAAVVVVLHDEV